jgi:hypothetical protein
MSPKDEGRVRSKTKSKPKDEAQFVEMQSHTTTLPKDEGRVRSKTKSKPKDEAQSVEMQSHIQIEPCDSQPLANH